MKGRPPSLTAPPPRWRSPFSLLSVMLLAAWLLANESLAPGQMIAGSMLALGLALAIRPLRPLTARPRRPWVALRLAWHVFVDIVRSNLAVSRIILGAARRQPNIEFIHIPLELRDPHGLAVLAIIITSTPGTVWGGHDVEQGILTLHVLDLLDEEAWRRTVKERYERPLMEIFE